MRYELNPEFVRYFVTASIGFVAGGLVTGYFMKQKYDLILEDIHEQIDKMMDDTKDILKETEQLMDDSKKLLEKYKLDHSKAIRLFLEYVAEHKQLPSDLADYMNQDLKK